jgi:predicted AlkP superfamily phosphohydrolase/phosphomutase
LKQGEHGLKSKVAVIGLDGATLDRILPWVKEGKLPNIARLMEQGCYGPLKSTPEKISPAAWTSFSTGQNPGKHGIHHFFSLDPSTFKVRMINATHRNETPFWMRISKAGKRVCIINVPATYPADNVNGYMVAGWDAPSIESDGFTHPPQLIQEIIAQFKHYPLTPSIKKYRRNEPVRVIQDIHRVLDLRWAVSKHLLEKEDWDLFVTIFTATDEAQHHFWHLLDKNHPGYDPAEAEKYGNTILDVYRKCDRIVGDIVRHLDEEATIVIMSDHGATANSLGANYLPQWLQRVGFAKIGNDGEAPGRAWNAARPLVFRKLKEVITDKLYSLLSYRTRQLFKRMIGWKKSGFEVRSTAQLAAYDWAETRAYTAGPNLMINLRGRERQGIVSPGREYDQVRDQIIAKLLESRDAKTGRKIVKEVLKREDVYHGEYVERAPDLIVNWADDVVIRGIVGTDLQGRAFAIPPIDFGRVQWSGEHSDEGVLIVRGPHVRQNAVTTEAEIIDVAPSILYLMGLPIPAGMDGKVLKTVVTDDFIRANDIQLEEVERSAAGAKKMDYSEEEAKKIEDNLKNLGYL